MERQKKQNKTEPAAVGDTFTTYRIFLIITGQDAATRLTGLQVHTETKWHKYRYRYVINHTSNHEGIF